MIKQRVWDAAGYADTMDGTLVSLPARLDTSVEEFDRMTVRELVTRSRSVEPTQHGRKEWSNTPPSRNQLRSSASQRLKSGVPAWAKIDRKSSTIIGNPAQKKTCIIRPETQSREPVDTWVKLPDQWMANVQNLGRVTDPFCHHLCSEPLYCFDLEQARHGRDPHMISSLGVYCGGPVYRVNFSQAIQKF